MVRSPSDRRGTSQCASSSSSASSACWPSSSTARSAWRTASRRRRCSSPPASLRPPPRPPSTSPRSAPRWSRASPTTSSATSTGGRSHPRRTRVRRRLRRRDVPGQPRRRHRQALGGRPPARCSASTSSGGSWCSAAVGRRSRHVPPQAFLAPMGLVGGTLDAIGGGGWGPVGTTTPPVLGAPRAAQGRRLDRHLGVRRRRRRLARASCSPSARQGIHWGYAGALLLGGVIAAPIAAWLVKHLAGRGARCRGRWPDRAHELQDHPRGAWGWPRPPVAAASRRRGRALDLRHRLGGPAPPAPAWPWSRRSGSRSLPDARCAFGRVIASTI